METRGRPDGTITWPDPGLLHNEHNGTTRTVEEQSISSKLSPTEMLHVAGYVRDQQWYCGDHDQLLPRRFSKFLELPGEIRNEIFKYAFPPGLIPRHGFGKSSIGLIAVNKQIRKEVMSLLYGTKPLRLNYDEDDLSIHYGVCDWDGQFRKWDEHSILSQLIGREVFQFVNDIEISVNLEELKEFELPKRLILQDLVTALSNTRRNQLRRFTVKFTVETLMNDKGEVEFFRFLQVLRDVPEFKDIRFEIEGQDQGDLERKDRDQLIEGVYMLRDSLLLGRKRKFGQLQE